MPTCQKDRDARDLCIMCRTAGWPPRCSRAWLLRRGGLILYRTSVMPVQLKAGATLYIGGKVHDAAHVSACSGYPAGALHFQTSRAGLPRTDAMLWLPGGHGVCLCLHLHFGAMPGTAARATVAADACRLQACSTIMTRTSIVQYALTASGCPLHCRTGVCTLCTLPALYLSS